MKTETPLQKALALAIKDMDRVCRENYVVPAQAERWSFEYATRARVKLQEHQEAIRIIQSMLDKLNGGH